ncbi:hypothetical protein GCM10023329_50460 [Streptomyces sanyensis]|uniref:Transposase Helix-turn-helix domain-containing protein n=1 Tax=Streptomyces sanyensis TaxID=568869 RepID=A0ABP9BCW9_9ACTN
MLRREDADAVRKGRPWSPPLEDRALLVAACWRTNLTMRQLAPLFGVSKSAADRIIDHLGPMLALQPRKPFARDTVLIVDGTLVPTRDPRSPSGRRTIGTPPTTRSSLTLTTGSGREQGRQPAVADQSCGYAEEGMGVLGLAFIAAVEASATGQPGHGSLDHPAVLAQPV